MVNNFWQRSSSQAAEDTKTTIVKTAKDVADLADSEVLNRLIVQGQRLTSHYQDLFMDFMADFGNINIMVKNMLLD